MKRYITLFLAFALLLGLAACGKGKDPAPTPAPEETVTPAPTPTPTPEETPAPFSGPIPGLTRENMPRLDGSTSTAPLGLAVCAALLGETEAEVADLVQFSRTTQSYKNLIHGDADLLIVAEAGAEVFEEKEACAFAWERAPFSTDAFVFVVNEHNPVESITVEQARKIYTGEITNWKQLGGADAPIRAFQRNSAAGSQTLMEKLVMQGTPMMAAPADYVIATMGNLMTAVKAFDGTDNAIGYSLYYYAEEMKMAQGLKLLAIDGVEPTPETIRSEEYPLVNPNYVVMAADTPADAPARLIYDWLLGPEGQQLVADMGYVSILDLTVTPRVTPSIGERWYEDYTDHLVCRDDYGALVPYVGRRLTDVWWTLSGLMYGLMTTDGKVVVDPVYSAAYRLNRPVGGEREPLDLLVLQQGSVEGMTRPAPGEGDRVRPTISIAAADGSWQTEMKYNYCIGNEYGLVLFNAQGLTLMDFDGSIDRETTWQDMDCDQETWEFVLDGMYWGREGQVGERVDDWIALWLYTTQTAGEYDLLCYDVSTGKVVTIDYNKDWWPRYEELYLSAPAETAPEPAYPVENATLLGREDGPHLFWVEERGGEYPMNRLFSADGSPWPELDFYGYFYTDGAFTRRISVLESGLVEVVDPNCAAYYDIDTRDCVFRTTLGFEQSEEDTMW